MLPALLLIALLSLSLQSEPIAIPDPQPAHRYVSRTHSLIHDTVRTGTGNANQKQLILTAEDLTAAANFLLLRKKLDGRAVCTIEAVWKFWGLALRSGF